MHVKGDTLAADKKRDTQKTTLNPLTFDEALAGLLATEPPTKPAKPAKASKPTKRRKPDDANPSTPTSTPRRKRAPKPNPDKTN